MRCVRGWTPVERARGRSSEPSRVVEPELAPHFIDGVSPARLAVFQASFDGLADVDATHQLVPVRIVGQPFHDIASLLFDAFGSHVSSCLPELAGR